MEKSTELQSRINMLKSKVTWCTDMGNEAANYGYWDIAKFIRNSASLANNELRGIELALRSTCDTCE